MKSLSVILSVLAIAGVITLFVMQGKHKTTTSGAANTEAAAGKIAYVDIDTLEAHYDYLKTKKDEFEKRQKAMEEELQRTASQLQRDYETVQKKYQAGTLTPSEGEAAQKRLMQGQESLKIREQSLTEQLLKDRDSFNIQLHNMLDSFLADYNRDKHYDYILRYSKDATVTPIMYADKRFDITQDVIKGMNDVSKKLSDTAKKK